MIRPMGSAGHEPRQFDADLNGRKGHRRIRMALRREIRGGLLALAGREVTEAPAVQGGGRNDKFNT
jgi:hypothetical protein